MTPPDKTKAVLEQLLADLYGKQASKSPSEQDSYLQAQDGQFLGRITKDKFDQESILNKYGPYGSPYSQTSIFNRYSPYGSPYGQFSINNPYSSAPPKLFIDGTFKGHVSKNRFVEKQVPVDTFLYLLKNDLKKLLSGNVTQSAAMLSGHARRGVYLLANDGAFLGSLDTNSLSPDSIFNQFSQYGNQFSAVSIFNNFGTYGNPYSALSPFNEFTATPPRIMAGEKLIAFLTKNSFLTPRVDPDSLEKWAKENA